MAGINVYQVGTALGTPSSGVSNVSIDNRGAIALAKEQGNTTNVLLDAAEKYRKQIVTADVMKVNNEYNMRMNDLRNQLMQNKEENALDNMAKYEEGRQKIMQDILKKGPQSIRYGEGNKSFMNTVERDWVSQRDGMQRFVIGESEKYQDTQTQNQLTSGMKNASENYWSDETIEEQMRRGNAIVSMRYANYGPERIKAETEKANMAMADNVISAAMTAGDMERAGALLERYGKHLQPKQRMQMDKAINEVRKSNDQLVLFDSIYKQTGGNLEAAFKLLGENNNINIERGMEDARSAIGEQPGDNQCANTASRFAKAMGVDPKFFSSTSDGMMLKYEQAGLEFTDRGQLRNGDLICYDNGQWKASNDPSSVENGWDTKEAYRGCGHVGIYDAKTGKVIQAGSNGISYMDIDAMKVVGMFHQPGGRARTPVEQQKLKDDYTAYMNRQEHTRIANENYQLRQYENEVLAKAESGLPYEQARQQALAEPDYRMQGVKLAAVDGAYSRLGLLPTRTRAAGTGRGSGGAGDAGSGYDDVEEYNEYGWITALKSGDITSRREAGEYLRAMNVSGKTYTSAMKLYDDYFEGKGAFSFNLGGRKSEFEEMMRNSGIKIDKNNVNATWNNVQAATVLKIQDYERANGREPNDQEVNSMMYESAIERQYGNATYTDGQLARAGIRHLEQHGDMYVVYYANDPENARWVGTEELDDIANGRYRR